MTLVLNSTDVTLYHLSNPDEKEFPYDKNHLREYRFRISGTKKEVSKWEVVGEDADYFTITTYGLVKTQWGPAYVDPCVTATVVATLEDGQTLKATVRAYSELNIYILRIQKTGEAFGREQESSIEISIDDELSKLPDPQREYLKKAFLNMIQTIPAMS